MAGTKAANEALLSAMKSNPEFAERMSQLRVDVPRTAPGEVKGASPDGWSWHHAAEPGVMQLVPRERHRAGNPFREAMYSDRRGGFAVRGDDF